MLDGGVWPTPRRLLFWSRVQITLHFSCVVVVLVATVVVVATRVRTPVSCWRVPKKPVKNPETRKAVPSISGYTVSPRAQAQTNLALDTEPLSPPFSLIESDFLKNFLKKSKRIVRRIDRLDIATLFFFPFLHRVLLFIGVALWVPEIGKDKSWEKRGQSG